VNSGKFDLKEQIRAVQHLRLTLDSAMDTVNYTYNKLIDLEANNVN
jgi:hypothetical protein